VEKQRTQASPRMVRIERNAGSAKHGRWWATARHTTGQDFFLWVLETHKENIQRGPRGECGAPVLVVSREEAATILGRARTLPFWTDETDESAARALSEWAPQICPLVFTSEETGERLPTDKPPLWRAHVSPFGRRAQRERRARALRRGAAR